MALHRGVHTADLIFFAIKNGHQGKDSVHDVYCSACGVMIARSRNNAEEGQPDIFLAGVSWISALLIISDYRGKMVGS